MVQEVIYIDNSYCSNSNHSDVFLCVTWTI